ncbi:MAG: hypothetical protein ABW000_24695 [Actinoplanes sp.]
MHRHVTVLAALALILAGCDSETPTAQPQPSSPPATTASPTPTPSATPTPATPTPATPTPTTAKPRPTAPPSRNVRDCYDGNCTLLLTKPTRIPLNVKKFHYSSMRVTAISKKSLTYLVPYPGGGGAQSTIGVGLGGSTFSFRGSPAVEVGLTLVKGKPALVLQVGPTA